MITAKIFKNGQSQAVRLPKEFRLPGKEVAISRCGTGILLEPITKDFSSFLEALDEFTPDYFSKGRQQPSMQVRAKLFS